MISPKFEVHQIRFGNKQVKVRCENLYAIICFGTLSNSTVCLSDLPQIAEENLTRPLVKQAELVNYPIWKMAIASYNSGTLLPPKLHLESSIIRCRSRSFY